MAFLDSKGRLFGKLSLLDLGAALVMVMVVIGIFVFPGPSGSLAQGGQTQAIEMDVLVRGLTVRDPDVLLDAMEPGTNTDIVVRNQPSGAVEIVNVELLRREVLVPQPDGSVDVVPEPRTAEGLSTDLVITLTAAAQVTEGAAVINQSQVKIGTGIELDGKTYNFKGSIIDVRLEE
ncbi:MAG: DUF4330 domain-containing protein [Cyanobacteria bacterium P01_G01_bin.54]